LGGLSLYYHIWTHNPRFYSLGRPVPAGSQSVHVAKETLLTGVVQGGQRARQGKIRSTTGGFTHSKHGSPMPPAAAAAAGQGESGGVGSRPGSRSGTRTLTQAGGASRPQTQEGTARRRAAGGGGRPQSSPLAGLSNLTDSFDSASDKGLDSRVDSLGDGGTGQPRGRRVFGFTRRLGDVASPMAQAGQRPSTAYGFASSGGAMQSDLGVKRKQKRPSTRASSRSGSGGGCHEAGREYLAEVTTDEMPRDTWLYYTNT